MNVPGLYRAGGDAAYYYRRGWNPKALAAFAPSALAAAVVALVPGSVVPLFESLAPFSWFIGAGLGAVFYLAITARDPVPAASEGEGDGLA